MATIWRLPKALAESGKTRSPWYADIARGLMTRPVKISGARAAGYPAHEVQAIINARVAGANDDELRALVDRLHDARKAAASMPLAA